MKNGILPFLVFLLILFYPNAAIMSFSDADSIGLSQNPIDRRLSTEEVRQRGIDLLANQIIANLDNIDLRQTARSAIFETSYGFRWKMINLHTGKKIIIKVDKGFRLISARNSNSTKAINP